MYNVHRIGVLAILLVVIATTRSTAWGNGVPVHLFLNYVPDVSNWGPETATGTATVAVGEGNVTVKVQGLPQLTDARYQVWLMPREGEPVAVGKFNVAGTGSTEFKATNLKLPEVTYKLLVITVEPDPDPSPQPDRRRSLVGRFPDPLLKVPLTGNIPGGGSGTPGKPLPTGIPLSLPVTGGEMTNDQIPNPTNPMSNAIFGISPLIIGIWSFGFGIWALVKGVRR